MFGFKLGWQKVTCPHCDSPVEYLRGTCPYCYKDIHPWSMNAPWVLPTIMTVLVLLVAFILVDQLAGLGYLQQFLESLRPKRGLMGR